jgi:hypothetical protein
MRTITALAMVLEIMLKALALVLVLITSMEAKAAPISLVCVGITDGIKGSQLGLLIDLATNTVMSDNFVYKITSVSPTVMTATLIEGGILEETLTLNRTTGLLICIPPPRAAFPNRFISPSLM